MVQMSKTYLHKSTWIILKSIMLNRDSIQLQEPGSGRKGNGGIGALVVFFNIYFFKEKAKTNVASCCYLSNLGFEYIFVIFCSFLMFCNKKFKRIFYNTVLKELPGSWGHETRRQLLKPIKKEPAQRA